MTTPQEAIAELLARLGARNGEAVFLSDHDLTQWPAAAVAAMKSQKLLAKARPAMSVVCPGCERKCVMPLHNLPAGTRGAAAFIVCDKRSDINRVPVSGERLRQWRCDAEHVCGFVAVSLGLRRSEDRSGNGDLVKIGMARGDKRAHMLCLKAEGTLTLSAGTGAIQLAELIGFDGSYSVDAGSVRQLVDAATTADPRYSPGTARREARKLDTRGMYKQWKKAYRDLRRRRRDMSDLWYARQIATQDIACGRSADTIRKHMKT